MNILIGIAGSYLGATKDEHAELVAYYNEFCLPLVASNRRYKMGLSDNWCAMFTSVIAHKARLGADNFPYEVSVQEQVKLAKLQGRFVGSSSFAVSVGDLIIYDWNSSGWANHVGFVKQVNNFNIVTIEGNYSGTVKERVVRRTSSAVSGFVRLSGVVDSLAAGTLETLVSRTLIGEFGDGEVRKKKLGVFYDEVQKMVNNILK